MESIEDFATERLRATRLQFTDFDILCLLHRDPVVMATLGGVRTDIQTERFLSDKCAHWEHHGFGYWIFRDVETGCFVGRGGLQYIDIGGSREIEVGYTVHSDFWKQGFATEMANAMVAIGFHQLDLEEIICFTLTTNLASKRVMQKVGFRFEKTIVHEGLPHVLYRLRRDHSMERIRAASANDPRIC